MDTQVSKNCQWDSGKTALCLADRQAVTCGYAKAKTKFNTDAKYFKHFL